MDSDGFIMNIGEERDMAETKELTIEQRAIAATHNILHHATTLEYRENMMSYIIREAEERGRVEMREKCAQVMDQFSEMGVPDAYASKQRCQDFTTGWQRASTRGAEHIRALPTSSEDQQEVNPDNRSEYCSHCRMAVPDGVCMSTSANCRKNSLK